MRRTIPVAMAALLILGATPVLAADAEESTTEEALTEPATTQRLEVPEVGLSMAFPADWRVSQPTGTRESPIRNAEDEPIYATTAILANGDGRWCDVDVYLDMTALLKEHAYAYVNYLKQVNGADMPMVVVETDLPAGPAFRIEVFDQERSRIRATYLFDGPVADDGTFDRYQFTCAAPSTDEPFWHAIADSAEVFVATEPEAAASPEASPEG